jgi:hypothetical protein
MPVPIFVDEIFCRDFSDCPKPLRTPRAHPDEISGGDGIPRVAEAIDAAAFEHQQAMLHDVHFDLTQCCAGIIDHGVYSKIERHFVGQEAFDL